MQRDLESLARDQECYLRLPYVCNHDRATTVLCHIRRGQTGGMGIKPDSVCAIPMCSACHDCFDGRRDGGYSRTEMDADALRGLVQWLTWLRKHEVLTVCL